ncbi:hypothetical protein BCIN_02g06280 [Botrytis cinerea B05.10]|uniref:Uncharacterized protein n=3 Tax=Botryotinia fuckeliana TaxID=40559 RepID=A0A384J9I3_BOTFB|nr:hypothetical protein BCIN_02g06280 [Botrytis cinerea B05.10]ATZ47338.1 hypothetical protein BCIN_02g06280 [Botrytis cinerea B05.10]EMR82154.1 hypothetical protein BcDW1_9184 [Botrytis cinerea BcDW1]CCD55777.1 hypothetical protein BofuT4_P153390.1 [Botrytis cinerea T4]
MVSEDIGSLLHGSSYQAPGGGALYEPLREKMIAVALEMGYDRETMTECGVNWSDDQDPFKHVKNHGYMHYMTACNMRVVFSFEKWLGKERFDDFMNVRHIGCVVQSLTLNLKRPVKFPDSLLVANRITKVLPDRYFGITTIWSLRQQAIVAENTGYMTFFNYDTGKPANLIEAGGVYKDLHDALVARMEKENKIAEQWEKDHPKKVKAKI